MIVGGGPPLEVPTMIHVEMVFGNNTQNCILWIHLKVIMVPYFSKFADKTLVFELNEVEFSKRPTMVKG